MRDYFWGSQEEMVFEEQQPERTKSNYFPFENNSTEDFNKVEFVSNRVYFYSGVSRPKILRLNKAITNLNSNLQARQMVYGGSEPEPIKLHINSYGGSVFAGLSAVDYILTSKVPIHTIIDGCAASSATLMSVVGSHRLMHRNACMLIHQLSGHMWGKYQDMQDDMKNSEMLMEKIRSIYKTYTRVPEKELDEMLKHDLWWNAETCLKYGLVDEII